MKQITITLVGRSRFEVARTLKEIAVAFQARSSWSQCTDIAESTSPDTGAITGFSIEIEEAEHDIYGNVIKWD